MIEIRQDQLDALSADRRADFKRRLVDHLRKHYAAGTAPYADVYLVEYADRCIERAKQYGLTSERAVACYAQLHWVLGRDFEARPALRFMVDMLHDRTHYQDDRAKMALALALEFRQRGVV